MKNWFAAASLGVAASLTVSAVADDDHGGRHQGKRVFRAELVSYDEVPSVSSPARGQFYAVLNKEENQLTYWLSFSGLTADVSQSHIHFGQHHTNGGIVVWLCEGTGTTAPSDKTPACGMLPTRGATVTGVITPAEVVGLGVGTLNQGIGLGEFAELIAAMRAGAAYANVHSGALAPTTTPPTPNTGFPGGEIRGQID
jgi:hypothetical protein